MKRSILFASIALVCLAAACDKKPAGDPAAGTTSAASKPEEPAAVKPAMGAGAATVAATTATAAPAADTATAATKGDSKFPGTKEGAKAMLERFLKPGADHAALTKELAPAAADYAAVFDGDAAGKAQEAMSKMWSDPKMALKPNDGQTELLLFSATTEELRAHTGDAGHFPGGYKKVAPKMKPGLTFYAFKFVKPGEKLGMAFDGLVFVNGHWAMFPKPWRAVGGD